MAVKYDRKNDEVIHLKGKRYSLPPCSRELLEVMVVTQSRGSPPVMEL
jgi:hypothetical protein